jgi:hypothetical protein
MDHPFEKIIYLHIYNKIKFFYFMYNLMDLYYLDYFIEKVNSFFFITAIMLVYISFEPGI